VRSKAWRGSSARRLPFADWQADPFARGGYCVMPVDGEAAQRRLAQPVADTLFFAGEATHWAGHAGTVHGALESGERAALEVQRAFC
jgi:monoamine oxidase